MNTELSLYELIKKTSQEKGRKLKVICDWDDCLQAVKPYLIYINSGLELSFEEFSEEFWQKTEVSSSSTAGAVIKSFEGSPNVKIAVEKFMEQRKLLKEENKKAGDQNYNFGIVLWKDYQPGFYKKTPFTTIADELLKALQENLMKELVIITSSRKPLSLNEKTNISIKKTVKEKEQIIKDTFCKYPNTKLSLSWVDKDPTGRLHPHRWEVIRDKFPDFDMYIDDNPSLIANSPSTLKFMNQIPNIKDKIFVLNDYKSNRKVKGPNIYHVKTTVSDIQPIHFAIGALEYRTKKLEQGIQELKINNRESQPNSSVPLWLTIFPIIGGILALLVVIAWKERKQKNKT